MRSDQRKRAARALVIGILVAAHAGFWILWPAWLAGLLTAISTTALLTPMVDR